MNENVTRFMLMVSMRVEDCPIKPPTPGNYWVGYWEPNEKEPESFEQLTTSNKKKIILKDSWIYVCSHELHVVSQKDGSSRLGVNQVGLIFPICDHADVKGVTQIVSIEGTIVRPSYSMQSDIEELIKETTRRMLSNRSNIAIMPTNFNVRDIKDFR